MRRSLVTLLIVTTNLCSFLDSYKINIDQSSKTIDAYDQQDSNLHKEYTEENYSNEDSPGRVVIGKWRSNGEALEPKWRDGDSVPLAPFSTISFQSGWGREPNSREDYRIEPKSLNRKKNKHSEASLPERDDDIRGEESRAPNKKNWNSNSERRDEEDENSKSITNAFDSATLIPTTEVYPLGKQRSGYKNPPQTETRFNAPDFDKENVNPSERRAAISKLVNTFREPSQRENVKGNVQGGGKYRETLENYRNDGYELFENENDDPRPRKRRPPENYEFPGTWSANNRREESYDEDKNRPGVQNLSANMASDVRRYLTTDQGNVFETRNQTKSPENVELKTFLKMQGNNLSLSEILQQKNLTLADLLRGKPGAINILKSNNKKSESVQEEVPTETPERNWPSRRIIILRKSNKNSNSYSQNNSSILNIGKTSVEVDTTTTSPVMETNNTNTELISSKLEETRSNISSPDSTKFSNDVGIASSEKFDQINPPLNERDNLKQEFLKPLENRESLLAEATTVVEDSAEHSSNDGRVSTSNERIVPANNDEDEIMEFSDYPAAKMPKFVIPVLYEGGMPNNKRKNIPFSAIRKSNPAEDDDDLKLSIENILSSKKKVSTIMNETHDVNEDNLGVKNIGVADVKKKEDEFLLIRNETQEIKLRENENVNSSPTEYRNSMIVGKSEDPRYKNERTAQTGTEEIAEKHLGNDFIKDSKERWINGNEMMPRDKKNLTLNHKLHEIVIPKVDPQSRAEILELFSSGSSAERLERLLASRNMTIEELIALRQRGSSQVHFAQVFKAKQQTPTSLPQNLKTSFQNRSNEATEKMVNELKEHEATTNVENNVNLLSAENSTTGKKKITFETEGEYSATDLLNEFSKDEKSKRNFATIDKTSLLNPSIKPHEVNPNTESRTGLELKKAVENSDLTMTLEKLPVDNDIQKYLEGSSYFTSIEAVKLPVPDEGIKRAPDIFKERKTAVINSASSAEIGRVEEILNNDLKLITNAYGINDYEYSEKKALSKVKPSIIASGGILGVTIVVFLSIFIACRIQQKKKFAYKNSFSKAVFHNPVMTARKLSNTSSVNTIMIDVVATSTPKRPQKHDAYESDDFEPKSDIDNDSLDANDSWDTIPDFMK